MTKIKICGIRRKEDAEYLNEFKPDYAGFILSVPFWRCIDLKQLELLNNLLSKDIKRVGVFVNENSEYILKYADLLDVIQLHGDENEQLISELKAKTNCEIWKAVRVQTSEEIENACKLSADKLLIDSYTKDTYGGSGKIANWDAVIQASITKPFFLAGGISAKNCKEAIEKVQPYGVDISSSVETEKLKDKEKIAEIVGKIRSINKKEG
ncbi:MAG: phosphoribosylanthranilate isomerase [Oscillospiraceae bacterium]